MGNEIEVGGDDCRMIGLRLQCVRFYLEFGKIPLMSKSSDSVRVQSFLLADDEF